MADLDLFLNEVAPDVAGAPLELIRDKLLEGAVELCARAPLLLYEAHPALDVVAGQANYVLAPPAGTLIACVLKARHGQNVLIEASRRTLDRLNPQWETTSARYATYYTLNEGARALRLVYTPNTSEAGALTLARVSLKPAPWAETVDDVLYQDWRQVIGHYARWKLYEMAKKPWSDGALAGYHAGRFAEGLGRACIAAGRDATGEPYTFDTAPFSEW